MWRQRLWSGEPNVRSSGRRSRPTADTEVMVTAEIVSWQVPGWYALASGRALLPDPGPRGNAPAETFTLSHRCVDSA
jgi:hypothetical protein